MKVSGYTTLVSDTKISKLILRFSILLLQISCSCNKNLARLRGGNILRSVNNNNNKSNTGTYSKKLD